MSPDLESDDEGGRELDVRVGFGVFASEDQVGSLLSIARRVDVEAGQVLYTSGDPIATLFQVVTGAVEIRSPELPAWRVQERGTVGMIDFATGRVHTRTAVATAPSQLLELDAGDYRDYLEDNYEVTPRILAQLSSRLTGEIVAAPELAHLLAHSEPQPARPVHGAAIPLVERLVLLSRMPGFIGTSTQALANLALSATERTFAAGEVIAEAGAACDRVSLLVHGTVELELPTAKVQRQTRGLVAHVEELSTNPRLTTTRCVTEALVLQLDRDDLIDRMEEHFDLAMSLFAVVAAEQGRFNDAAAGRCRIA